MNSKVEPIPYLESKLMSPLNSFTIILLICNPSPIPFVLMLLLDSRNPKSLKSLPWSYCFIPIPESSTLIKMDPWSPLFGKNWDIIFTYPPFWVNFKAFEKRFNKTCWRRMGSVHIIKLVVYSPSSFKIIGKSINSLLTLIPTCSALFV